MNSRRATNILAALAFLLPMSVSLQAQDTERFFSNDSVMNARADSLLQSLEDTARWNRELQFARDLEFSQARDSDMLQIRQAESTEPERLKWKQQDSLAVLEIEADVTDWEPNPRKATILALLVPGGGQIYNRKYWKLPIVYGGFVGCIYALTWNQSTYSDYKNAYVDIMDSDPNTKSYEDFLPPNYEIDTSMESWLKDVFKNRKNKYRRYRDLSIFAFAGMYVLSAIDAYVDAELSHFDISPNLSMDVEPQIMIDRYAVPSAGFSLAINF